LTGDSSIDESDGDSTLIVPSLSTSLTPSGSIGLFEIFGEAEGGIAFFFSKFCTFVSGGICNSALGLKFVFSFFLYFLPIQSF